MQKGNLLSVIDFHKGLNSINRAFNCSVSLIIILCVCVGVAGVCVYASLCVHYNLIPGFTFHGLISAIFL